MKRRAATLMTLMLATGTLAACTKPPVEQKPAAPEAPSSATAWVAARPATQVPFLEAPARVLASPDSQAALAPPLEARIVKVPVRPGQQLKKGVVIAEVLMPELVAAAGSLASSSELVRGYEARRETLLALKKDGLALSGDLAEVEAKLAEARAQRQLALSTLRLAGYSAGDAARLLESPTVPLRAPIAGVLVALDAVPGEIRAPSGEPLARIVGEGEVQVEARMPSELPQEAKLEFVDAAGSRVPLTLVSRSPLRDPVDGSTTLWARPAQGAGAALAPGASGRVQVSFDDAAALAVVPSRAIAAGEQGTFVLVREGGSISRVPVTVRATGQVDALVEGSLQQGAEVAADAAAVVESGGAE